MPPPSPSEPSWRLLPATDITARVSCAAFPEEVPEPRVPEPVEPPDPPPGPPAEPPPDADVPELEIDFDPLLVEVVVAETFVVVVGAVTLPATVVLVETFVGVGAGVGVGVGEVTELTVFSTVLVTVETVEETVEVVGSVGTEGSTPLTPVVPLSSDGTSAPNASPPETSIQMRAAPKARASPARTRAAVPAACDVRLNIPAFSLPANRAVTRDAAAP
jgi:hypothetical protein